MIKENSEVLIYTRVSTDDQAKLGYSLAYQEKALREYCRANKLTVVNHFREDYSAKDFIRPEWIKLENFVKEYQQKSKSKIHAVLALKLDRFSRNAELTMQEIRKFRKNYGIEINFLENPIDYTNPDHKLLMMIQASMAEIENDKIAKRTKQGSKQARIEGCWTGKAPFGYSHYRNNYGKSTLVKNEKSIVVQEIFDEFSRGLTTADSLRKRKNKEGKKFSKTAFNQMLKNVAYIGKIVVEKKMMVILRFPKAYMNLLLI